MKKETNKKRKNAEAQRRRGAEEHRETRGTNTTETTMISTIASGKIRQDNYHRNF
jgi:hypothetical protein